jgi:hypothetical protein
MTFLENLRLSFLARARREKVLAVMVVVVLAALWVILFLGRVRTFGPQLAELKRTANDQTIVISGRDVIEADYAAAVATLSDENRPSGKVAYETVDQIVRGSGYNFRIDPPAPERRDQLTFHPINVNIYKSDFFKLADIFRTIKARLPTVNLAEVVISVPDKTNPQLLDARFKFVAIEFNR